MRIHSIAAAMLVYAAPVLAALPAPDPGANTVVEYYHAGLDHYFITRLPAEIAALDSGRTTGWVRTGSEFEVNPGHFFPVPPPANSVCRFYIPPQHGDSHFFSASVEECAAVRAKIGTDPNYSGYIEETPEAFRIYLPDSITGSCGSGGAAIYRMWNQRADSNHRYVVDPALKVAMLARGYVAEGYGPDSVAMCAVRAVNAAAQAQLSGASPFAPGCERVQTLGVSFTASEVEPMIAVNPSDPAHFVAIWQQDRWSNGGSRGLLTAMSRDGGATWSISSAPFSRCTGGNAANGGDYPRVSNPWVAFGRDGTVYATSLSFGGAIFTPSSFNAILVSRSQDGGATWSNPATLIRDTNQTFNDKDAVTADPTNPRFAYVVWDRLAANGWGPSYFARTTDAGATWEPAKPIHDPGNADQTINNQIVVASDGTLVNFFTLINNRPDGFDVSLAVVRSRNQGETWSDATPVARALGVGTQDPDTGLPIRDGTFCGSIAAGPNGLLVAVWQDARFSGGARDGVALVRSTDGGLTWSEPVQVNRRPDVQALLPAVAVKADGTIAVTYYDLRSNTSDPATLLTDNWIVESADGGATWREMHLMGPFDLTRAPVTDTGYFLGDYQGLAVAGNRFVPAYAAANAEGTSDIVATVGRSFGPASSAVAPAARKLAALDATPVTPSAELARRVQENTRRALAARGRLPR